MSGELRKPHTLMRLRHWLGKLLANVSAGWSNGSRNLPGGVSMRRRWFALIGFTALLFPSYPLPATIALASAFVLQSVRVCPHGCVRTRNGRFMCTLNRRVNSSTTPLKQEGSTIMNVIIQKLNGLWHLIVGSCQIRTPFLETQDRALVVAYARRVYPGAKILERD